MPYTDAYGTWLEITTNYSPSLEWNLFEEQTAEKNLFRFKFQTDWDKWNDKFRHFRSYGLFRFHYHDDSGTMNNIGTQHKIYPTQEPQLLELPGIESLISNPWYIRKVAFKRKFFKWYPWLENDPIRDLKWTVSIELFLG